MNAAKPAELPVTTEQLETACRATSLRPYHSYSKATKAERDSLRDAVLYSARHNSRRINDKHVPVVDMQRIQIVKAGPTWTTYHDLDYEFIREQLPTKYVIEALAAGGLAGMHRTEQSLRNSL